MASTIITKYGSGAPTASDLVQGELAVDLTNKRLYTEDGSANILEIGINPTSVTTGNITATGTINFASATISGTIDGRDISVDGAKLDTIESNADVTDTANVTAAGALMDSELTNIAAVKALNQGVATSNSPTFAGTTINGNITVTGTVDGRDVAADGTKLDGIEANADVTDTANVTAAGALMDSELTDIAAVKALDQGVATTDSVTHTGLDLSAISDSIADTAVDVFVYDTSKDSDGGAWRKRTQHTSWYNETLNTATRGSRREFPAVAVIVAEASKVTIYDADDPTLPMWMVFQGDSGTKMLSGVGSRTSLAMLNGKLVTGSTVYGYGEVNFIDDTGNCYFGPATFTYHVGPISRRNVSDGYQTFGNSFIVNANVNDVAMTVLPNAPIDQATGLPVPTIAVATSGGISVIKDDGTVANSSITNAFFSVAFADDGYLYGRNVYNQVNGFPSFETNPFGQFYLTTVSTPALLPSTNHVVGPELAFAGASGLSRFDRNYAISRSLISYITSTYNTGWMQGDIKGAWLSDTDDTDVTGTELVTNGDFATNDLTGWTNISLGTGTANASTGAARLTGTDTSNRGWINTSFSTVVGKSYVVTFEVTADAGGITSLGVGGVSGSVGTLDFGVSAVGFYTKTFVASTTTTHVNFRTSGVTDMTIDNVSVRLADADRSVNNNGLQVYGTITKTAVATGADLVAYSGFGASNYLQQPYNSNLDFGTGDFYVMGWFKEDTLDTLGYLFSRDAVTSAANINVYVQSGQLTFKLDDNSSNYLVQVSSASVAGSWQHFVGIKNGNTAYVYINGQQKASLDVSTMGSLTNTSAITSFGLSAYSTSSLDNGSLALWRVGAGAPSAEQIKKIYEDEKVLFQDGAQATLYGSSDAVTALAYDEDTNLLHVGTSAGRSVFQGLKRVDNTTTAVGAAISASNGLVAEE